MAGIKRKSTGASATDVKDKNKKVKVDKPTTKSEKKRDVKPVKKAKKTKEESSDDFEESDTSEKDNGFYGFSAADGADVDMSDADSSDEQPAKSNGKTQKRKDDNESSNKPEGEGVESKLAGLNGKIEPSTLPDSLANHPSSKQFERGARKTKSPCQRTKGREAKRRHHRTLQEAVGEAQAEVACRQGREERARQGVVRDHNWQSQGLCLQARLCACHSDGHQIFDNGAEADDRERAEGRVQGPG